MIESVNHSPRAKSRKNHNTQSQKKAFNTQELGVPVISKKSIKRKNTVFGKRTRTNQLAVNSREDPQASFFREKFLSNSEKLKKEGEARMTNSPVNSPDLVDFRVLPQETIRVAILVSSKVIFRKEVCVEYRVSTSFSARSQVVKVFATFRAPKITLSQRIEKLGTLPLYSKINFSVSLKNHEKVHDYMLIRPKNFNNFTDDIVEEIIGIYQAWVEKKDIYSSDFLEREEVIEINQLLKYLARTYPLQCQDYIVKVPKKSSFQFPMLLDNLYSKGTLPIL